MPLCDPRSQIRGRGRLLAPRGAWRFSLVNPAASLAGLAKHSGATLIIITLSDTPYDDAADVVIHGLLAEILPRIVALALDRH